EKATVSYITGSHAFKAGVQLLEGVYDFTGMSRGVQQVNYTFRAGSPASLTEWAGPFISKARLSSLGLFVQDQWTVKKLTLNVGVRFDRFYGHTLPLTTQAGRFVPSRSVPALDDLPNYKDITPRVGASYDLFGNGKTAIKGAFGRYLFSQGGNFSQQFSPSVAVVPSVARTSYHV